MFPRQPKHIGEFLKDDFSPENMGPGLKRGMVLKVAPSKIKEALKTDAFKSDLKSLKLTGKDDNPALIISIKPGSMWRIQIHQSRHQILKLINDRMKSQFIREIRVY